MRVYFNTEFTGLHQNTTLISIGLLADNGHTFYAELITYNRAQLEDWHRENVIPHLWYEHLTEVTPKADSIFPAHYYMKGNQRQVADALKGWFAQYEAVEMWGDCLPYDWVLFCQLFGGGIDCLPPNVYYIPFDLCTLLKLKGIDPDITREELSGPVVGQKHNALYDAAVIGMCVKRLLSEIPE